MASPFDEDCAAHEVAQSLGDFEVIRRVRKVEVFDSNILPISYWVNLPDKRLIQKHLEAGHEVPGARLVESTEYVLRKRND